MSLFFTLVGKILPLYVFILLGFIAKKKLNIVQETISSLLIYIIVPAVVFLGTFQAGLKWELLSLPLVFFSVATILCFLSLKIAKKFWSDGTEKIIAFSAGNTNTGYFGIPVCLALLGDEALPVAVMASLGLIVYENTVGFYVVARSSYTITESLRKIIRIPTLYAFAFGVMCHVFHIDLPQAVLQSLDLFKASYVLLGMMIIGIGLASVKPHHLDVPFTCITLLNKFISYPICFFIIILVDRNFFHFYNELIYAVIFIESITPIAANTVSYATELKAHPEKAAIVVFVSTLIALVFVPTMTAIFL